MGVESRDRKCGGNIGDTTFKVVQSNLIVHDVKSNGFIAQIFHLGSQCSSNARTDVIYMPRVNVLKRLMSCETTMVCLHCKTPIPTPILILIPVKCTKATMGLILIVIPMQSYNGN